MSEFKFACPVCGQHITASRGASGTQIECPTCFQKIIVPQVQSSDSKLILNAAQANKPRPPIPAVEPDYSKQKRPSSILGALLIVGLLIGVAAAIYQFRGELGLVAGEDPDAVKGANTSSQVVQTNPMPRDVVWSGDLKKVTIPEKGVAGALRGQGFQMTRATLQGGNLTLRQGKGSPPELAVAVVFPARRGEALSGKDVSVAVEQGPPRPRVVMRWKDESGKGASKTFTNGYALKVEFGMASGGRMPGKIYLALPDEEKSVVAGSFEAEIRAPVAPKKKAATGTNTAASGAVH